MECHVPSLGRGVLVWKHYKFSSHHCFKQAPSRYDLGCLN